MRINLLQLPVEINRQNFIDAVEGTTSILQEEWHEGFIRGGKVKSGVVELQIPKNLVIVGDLHGDIKSLYKILHGIDYENFLLDHENKMIFLGDYGDRGDDSIEVLYAALYLKQKYPDSIILMRGNHEAPVEFPFESHDLPACILERFGRDSGQVIYEKMLKLFKSLTLITVIKSHLLLVHGGPPTEIESDYNQLVAAAQCNYGKIMEELLWNDPRTYIKDGQDWEKSRRKFGRHFGSNISERWLQSSGTKVIVRGHEPCQAFRIDHKGKVLTLFSCKQAYPAFEAGYVSVSEKQLGSVNNANDLARYVKVLDS